MKLIIVIGDHLNDSHIQNEILDLTGSDNYVLFPEHFKHPWEHMRWLEKFIIDSQNYLSSMSIAIITNSAYIVDHMCNLMLGYEHPCVCAKYLLTKNLNAFINPYDVCVYEYKEGILIDILDRDRCSIAWDSIAAPSNYCSEVYYNITKTRGDY